jgi:hypothetical protein
MVVLGLGKHGAFLCFMNGRCCMRTDKMHRPATAELVTFAWVPLVALLLSSVPSICSEALPSPRLSPFDQPASRMDTFWIFDADFEDLQGTRLASRIWGNPETGTRGGSRTTSAPTLPWSHNGTSTRFPLASKPAARSADGPPAPRRCPPGRCAARLCFNLHPVLPPGSWLNQKVTSTAQLGDILSRRSPDILGRY